MEKEYDIIVERGTERERLDVFLSKKTGVSRSQVDKLIKSGSVRINGQVAKQGHRVKADDRIIFSVPEPKDIKAIPEEIPLNIAYEDSDLIVVDKSPGMVVHPAVGNTGGTLVNALLHYCKDLSGIGGCVRPGVVHRLDKDTSGLIVFAKNDRSHLELSRQIKERKFRKIYTALVHGAVKSDEGIIDFPIGRNPSDRKKMAVIRSGKLKKRDALTHYRVIERFKGYTLLELDLKTGRTHQIRVHLSHIGHPIVGDRTYSRRKDQLNAPRQLLHATILGFNHPTTGKYMEFRSKLPDDMEKILGGLVEDKAGDSPENK